MWSPVLALPNPADPYPGPLSDLPWGDLAFRTGNATLAARANVRELDANDADRLAIQSIRDNPHAKVGILASQSYPVLKEILYLLNLEGKVLYIKPIYLRDGGPKKLLEMTYNELCDHKFKWATKARSLQKQMRRRFSYPHPIYGIYYEFRHGSMACASAKRYIRSLLSIGVSGIHITDSHKESILLAELLFDNEKIAMLNAS